MILGFYGQSAQMVFFASCAMFMSVLMIGQLLDKPIHVFSTKHLGLCCFAPLIARILEENVTWNKQSGVTQTSTFSMLLEIPLTLLILSCVSGLLLFLGEININVNMYYHY